MARITPDKQRYDRGDRDPAARRANTEYKRARKAERYAYTQEFGLPRTVPHGGYSAYTNWGCRCDECTEAARVRVRRYRATGSYSQDKGNPDNNRYATGARDEEYSTTPDKRRYSNGDRDEAARRAKREYEATRRVERYTYTQEFGLPSTVAHGYNAYTSWGCRCDECQQARRRHDAERQPRQKT